jgi:ubiquinone/menaquinone biosynthesis C-methylase UbiE
MNAEISKEKLLRGDRLFPKKTERHYWVLSEMRRAYSDLISRYLKNENLHIVDYGCGNMPYRSLFEKKNNEYRGYDFEGNDLAYGSLEINGSLPGDLVNIDCLVSAQVLEHVTNVTHYLNEAKRVLKPGGLLFLSTHGTWRYHPDPTDYWRWTGDGLKKIITEAGFTIEEFVGVVGPVGTGLQIIQDATHHKIPKFLKKIYFLFFQTLMALADLNCSNYKKTKEAAVFICVAKQLPGT